MGLILFIISALAVIGLLIYSIFVSKDVMNNTVTKINFKSYFLKNGLIGGGFTISLIGFFLSIYLWAGLKPTGIEVVSTIFGGLGFGVLGFICLHTFLLHYYGKKIPDNVNKWLFISLMIAFPIMFLFIFLLSNGFADYLNSELPLVNGINFSTGWVRPGYGKTNIAFYALCIISGAVYTYLYCDHKFYIEYGKHGILESTFLVAFPAGIIGARVFYVIGLWDEFAGDFMKMINMTDGGLTILGGAITGIVVGVAWFLWRNKQYSIWVAVDIIVPAILIAQAVGRWGNFFNCEVYGQLVDDSAWKFLPKVIWNNMHYDGYGGGSIESGKMYVPLFLIEGIINFLGFFVLAHVFGKALRKYTELGDLCFGYVGWYGLTRVLLEPIRDDSFKMGFWSWFWSFAFVFASALLIVANHLIRYLIRKKKGELHVRKNSLQVGLIGTGTISIISIAMVVPGISLMVNNTFEKNVPQFNQFNIGLTLFVLGISLLLGLGISIPKIIEGIKLKEKQNVKEV